MKIPSHVLSRAEKMGVKLVFSAILVYSSLFLPAVTEPIEDKRALLDFSDKIYHSRKLNWDETTSACSGWTGITCNRENSRVLALRLPGIGLKGVIPSNTLSRLSDLQILSLRSNGLSGSFPVELLQLTNLIGLHLQSNDFEGPLPSDLSVWNNLTDFECLLKSTLFRLLHRCKRFAIV